MHILKIIDGSIILTFHCLDVLFPLSSKQEELQEIGVVRIYSEEQDYYQYSLPPILENHHQKVRIVALFGADISIHDGQRAEYVLTLSYVYISCPKKNYIISIWNCNHGPSHRYFRCILNYCHILYACMTLTSFM